MLFFYKKCTMYTNSRKQCIVRSCMMDDFFSRAADSEASFKSILINQSQRMSWIRLLMFILMVFAAAATYDLSPSGNALGAAAICVICFIAFIVAVRHHRAIRHRILRSDCHLAVLSRLMGQHRGAWSKLLYKRHPHGRGSGLQAVKARGNCDGGLRRRSRSSPYGEAACRL